MAKIFKGDVNFGFVINQTGAQPLDSRSVVQSYSELLKAETFGTAIYNGMTVATIDEQKVYMLVDKTKATLADGWKEIGAGGAVSVETYAEAVALASDENIGQVIYVKTKSSFDADGEGEGVAIEYDAAPYIVIGEGSLQKLAASTASGDIEGDVAELTTKVSGLETTVGNAESGLVKDVADLKGAMEALPETFVTDVKVGETSLVADGVADLSNFVQKDGDKVLSTNDYTTADKDKLAGIAAGAEVNYVKSVGDNLAVDGEGKLTVTIPEVEVPFQSVADGDKVLTLNKGVLSSTLSYVREEVEGVDSLVLKGIDGAVIGSIPVADFIADGMLESVAPKEEGSNIFVFTFNSAAGSKSFEVDFSKYVDTYRADGTTIELGANNTFNVKAGVFEVAGAASGVESKLNEYKTSNDAAVAAKVDSSDYNAKIAEIDGSISTINASLETKAVKEDVSAALDLKANVADVYDSSEVDNLLSAKVNSSDYNAKMTEIDGSISTINTELAKKADATTVETSLNGKVDKVEGSSLVSDTLIAKLGNMVEIKSVEGDLTFADGALSLDLSSYATSVDVANTYVAKEEGKGLSTNDFTNDLKTKLEGIADGAEVNYVKSVGANLAVSGDGELTVDLSALATSESLTNGLAAKLDASAKVNGVSFADGEATLDAGDIALEAAITRTENGEQKNVYEATASIQSVLANLSARIDTLDPNISGKFGVSAITAGNGIEVSGASSTPTISVKASAVEGNMAEVKTDGVYVQDMRSYWEAI